MDLFLFSIYGLDLLYLDFCPSLLWNGEIIMCILILLVCPLLYGQNHYHNAIFCLLHNNLFQTEKKSVYVRYNCNPSTNNHDLCCIKSTILTPKIQS